MLNIINNSIKLTKKIELPSIGFNKLLITIAMGIKAIGRIKPISIYSFFSNFP
ncbi:hypothetical protein BN3087_450041 [Sulfurovum sp. enrichment culture clone C5]|uniref:Uncharacterized protein n=1 Tax=Sulfurovum sp. enrichment culture clone C5 TaxID=497650 RepID=A0A0S4XNE5_9BACT|nr:hypothetical protein BN3087_450041 [Sulfurovum sp. enrichment culture clone C5]